MKSSTALGYGLIAFAGYKMLTRRPSQPPPPPPAPSGNLQNNYLKWVAWAGAAFSIFKQVYPNIKDMWQPGGIFYKTPVPEYDAGSIFWDDASAYMAGVGKLNYRVYPLAAHIRKTISLTFKS